MRKFKIGDKVVCTAKERPFYFNNSGDMDYLLNEGAVLEVVGQFLSSYVVVVDIKELGKNHWIIEEKHLKRYEEAETKEDVFTSPQTLNDRLKRRIKKYIKRNT